MLLKLQMYITYFISPIDEYLDFCFYIMYFHLLIPLSKTHFLHAAWPTFTHTSFSFLLLWSNHRQPIGSNNFKILKHKRVKETIRNIGKQYRKLEKKGLLLHSNGKFSNNVSCSKVENKKYTYF